MMHKGCTSLEMSKRALVGAPLNASVHLKQPCTVSTRRTSRAQVVVRAESRGGFTTGLVIGGAIGGILGFLYAPQISKALLDEQERLRFPFLNEEPPQQLAKDDLVTRVDELNSAVDDLTAKITSEKEASQQAA